jgi:hypothetical protein
VNLAPFGGAIAAIAGSRYRPETRSDIVPERIRRMVYDMRALWVCVYQGMYKYCVRMRIFMYTNSPIVTDNEANGTICSTRIFGESTMLRGGALRRHVGTKYTPLRAAEELMWPTVRVTRRQGPRWHNFA